MTVPLERGAIGELFWSTTDAVAMLRAGRVIAWNPAAERLFGVAAAVATGGDFRFASLFGDAAKQLAALLESPTGWVRLDTTGDDPVSVEATAWRLADNDVQVVVFRDHTAQLHYAKGLRLLTAFARDVLAAQPSFPDLAQQVADLAKELTGASYSGLLLVEAGGGDVSHSVGSSVGSSGSSVGYFAYNAPREAFPERLPRPVGVLGLPLRTGVAVRVDDVRAHPQRVGLPAEHPPLAAFLGVPLPAGSGLLGEIVVANAPGRRVFTETDERLVVDLAMHACVALRWADSTERARAEEQRRRDVSNAARHDIANPLSVGRGYLTMLERRYDEMSPEQRAVAIGGLRQAFSRLEEFSGRLLLDERLSHEGVAPRWSDVAVAPLLGRLTREHTVAAAERRVRVVGRIEDDSPAAFAADPGMVREVLDNLVGNAVKLSAEGAVVRICARAEGDHAVRFDVTDSGPGIPLEEQAQLFERFSRTEASRRGRVPGTGLGLSIVRRLVAAHGGTVGVSSRPGEGSMFWVTFPVRRPAGAAGQPGST